MRVAGPVGEDTVGKVNYQFGCGWEVSCKNILSARTAYALILWVEASVEASFVHRSSEDSDV